MKISDCKHLPEKFAGPKSNKCEGGEDKWVSLRVCLTCGHVGCCDSSPGLHARKHAEETGHQVMASYPADKNSFIFCYEDNDYLKPDKKIPVDYFAIGHAVFSSPQVGGVGKTEQELKKEGIPYKVGRAELKDTGMGGALQENGLAKVLADEAGEKILGVNIVGPEASTLIHEAIIAMKANGTVGAIINSVYIHPALPEWLQRAFFL